MYKFILASAVLLSTISAHAATFNCEGITVTYNNNAMKQADDGNFYVASPETLIVSGIAASDLKTYGELTFDGNDSIQKVGIINGKFVNLMYYPATKEATLTSDVVQYKCESVK